MGARRSVSARPGRLGGRPVLVWVLVAAVAVTTMGAASGTRGTAGSAGKGRLHPPGVEPAVPRHKTGGKAAAPPGPHGVTPGATPVWPAAASADVTLSAAGH